MSNVSSIRPTRSQLDDFATVCAIDEVQLRAVVERINAEHLIIDRERLEDIIAGAVGKSATPALSRVVFSVATLLRQDESFVQKAFNGVTAAISEYQNISPERFANWPVTRRLLEDIIATPSIKLAAKARDIAYDFERLYTTSRFLTTIRPVYNDDRTEILGAAVVQTLRIEFMSSSGDTTNISIAFDANDIEQLKGACEDAIRKGRIASADVSKHWKIPVSVIGAVTE